MSEQTPRRRRADRAYTPEENEAAPCRRRMNADEPPRRRRTREYYSPEEFIPYPAADSFDTMPPDIPFDVPPDTPSAPPKRKFRLPPLGESLRRTMQLLRSARPDFPFHSPHRVGDLLNMLLDVLLWLPKLTVHLTLYACRYLRASVRYAVEGATPLWQAFLLRPYSWAGFYLLLGGLAFGGVHLMSRGSTGASFAGFVLLLAPLAWGIVLGWAAANALHRHCFFSRWTFVALEVLCVLGIAGALLGYPIALLASAPPAPHDAAILLPCRHRRFLPAPEAALGTAANRAAHGSDRQLHCTCQTQSLLYRAAMYASEHGECADFVSYVHH